MIKTKTILLGFAAVLSVPALTSAANIHAKRDGCDDFKDRSFVITSLATTSSLWSQTHEAGIYHDLDPDRKIAGPEAGGCVTLPLIGKIGGMCKWEKDEKSKMNGSPEYYVNHTFYWNIKVNDHDVQVSGEGCDDQNLLCTSIVSGGGPGKPPDPPYDPGDVFIISDTKCAVERPVMALDDAAVKRYNRIASENKMCGDGKTCDYKYVELKTEEVQELEVSKAKSTVSPSAGTATATDSTSPTTAA